MKYGRNWRSPDLSEGPLRDLNDALHELHARSGHRSSRQIAGWIKQEKGSGAVSHTTIHQMLTTPQLPPPELMLWFVEALVAHSLVRDPEATYDRFDALWNAAYEHQRQQQRRKRAPARRRITVLGPLRAWSGEQELDLGPARMQAVLAALILRPAGAPVGQQEILDGVWGIEPPASGSKIIPTYISRLRRYLAAAGEDPEEWLTSLGQAGYRFVGNGFWVDARHLEEITIDAQAAEESGDLTTAAAAYSSALGLFSGEPLAGVPGPFAEGERRRLAEHRITLVLYKARAQLQIGSSTEVVEELSAFIAGHPHSEPIAALLMRALQVSDRQSDALAVFAETRRRLVADLGVEPGEELRRVHQAVLRGDRP